MRQHDAAGRDARRAGDPAATQNELPYDDAIWLRRLTAGGVPLPAGAESAEAERERAERAEHRIAELEARLARIEECLDRG